MNLEYVKTIERLSAENKYLQSKKEDFLAAQQQAKTDARAALFDIGKNLSDELIKQNKKEFQYDAAVLHTIDPLHSKINPR